MARRKTKRRAPRRYKGAINLLAVAEGTFYASQLTKTLFGTTAIPFLTEGWLTPSTRYAGSTAGQGVYGSAYWDKFSLMELIELAIPGGATGGTYPAQGMTFPKAVMANARTFGPNAILMSMVGGVGFRVLKAVSSRPRRFVNKGIRALGMGNVVKV